MLITYSPSAPSIVNSLGYSTVRAQLFTVPPYACAFVVSMTLAFVSDRWRARGLVSIASAIIALAGYAMFCGKTFVFAPGIATDDTKRGF